MRKALIAAAILGVCGIANADSNICNYSTDYNIDIDQQRVIFNARRNRAA